MSNLLIDWSSHSVLLHSNWLSVVFYAPFTNFLRVCTVFPYNHTNLKINSFFGSFYEYGRNEHFVIILA